MRITLPPNETVSYQWKNALILQIISGDFLEILHKVY